MATAQKSEAIKTKQVIDGLAANAFRVIGVGQDMVIESFYLYPNFSALKVQDGKSLEFTMDPDSDDEPNIRIIMSRDVASRLAVALNEALGNA